MAVAAVADPMVAPDPKARLKAIIRERSVLRDGPYTLASGAISDHFLDLKKTILHPDGINAIADLLLDHIEETPVDAIGGLEIGAPLIAMGVCARSLDRKRPVAAFIVRKEAKDHGTKKVVEGLQPGWRVVVVEDVTTRGGSVLRAVRAARDHGCEVVRVISIVDRGEGAIETLAAEGVALEHLFTWKDFE